MAYRRTAIPFFELANSAYASSTVTFFGVDDSTNARLTTLITLYAAKTGSVTLSNPLTLDSDGKFSVPVYALERTIAVVQDVGGAEHETGIWEPALSNADVAAAAASAASAALSAVDSANSAGSASTSQTLAAISAADSASYAAGALALIGSVKGITADTSPGPLDSKLDVSGIATKSLSPTSGDVHVIIGVPVASNVEAIAKSIATKALTPSNLAALYADSVTSGLLRLATAAEVTTGTATTVAVTPADVNAMVGPATAAMIGSAYTNVSAGANVTMTANLRYRMSGTTAATVNLKNTLSAGQFNIVEMACTTGAIQTVGRNGNTTIDGSAADDTDIEYGRVILYRAITTGVITTVVIGALPQI